MQIVLEIKSEVENEVAAEELKAEIWNLLKNNNKVKRPMIDLVIREDRY